LELISGRRVVFVIYKATEVEKCLSMTVPMVNTYFNPILWRLICKESNAKEITRIYE